MSRGAVRDVKRTAMNLPPAPPILPHSNSCLGSAYVASRTFVGIESTLHGLYSPMRLRPEDGTLPSPPIPGKASLDRHHPTKSDISVRVSTSSMNLACCSLTSREISTSSSPGSVASTAPRHQHGPGTHLQLGELRSEKGGNPAAPLPPPAGPIRWSRIIERSKNDE